MALNILILIFLTIAALWMVMTRSLLRSAIGLALVSVVLTIIMFRLDSPLAAVFELSVCAGLIPVLFISTISLTHPLNKQEMAQHVKERFRRFWYLPLVIVVAGVLLGLFKAKFNWNLPLQDADKNVRDILWNLKPLYLVGQIIVLLVGAFGVVILFKDSKKDER
ncbi:MAG: NADH-quinone oxidoreductase subunit J [Candidatus Omnitrophota bacterium]|jgi:NADH-quinone oxidoreductase subunit J